MNKTYEWLFDSYAEPKLKDIEEGHIEVLQEMAECLSLSKKERLRLQDMVSNMRLQWGTEAFALGVRFGLRLTAPQGKSRDCQRLKYYLPE